MDVAMVKGTLGEVRVRIKEIKEEQAVLERVEEALTKLLAFNTAGDQFWIPTPTKPLSYPKGVEKVLKDAHGELLTVDEIWGRMQALGIRSNGKRPTNYISLNANNIKGVQRVEKGVYRWASDGEEEIGG